MNFWSGGAGGGFNDQGSSKGTPPFSHSSSSSSSSSSRKILVPFSFQQHQRSGVNNGELSTELVMMDSPTTAGESTDEHRVSSELDLGINAAGVGGSSGTINSMLQIEREHMFDKVVTPSDVGKLNRLVIPKQHAEKYFPLDSNTNEKGLLLNFEDRNGKPWRFRYSYWNSSQSYVMTKGWSRFVKEKKLDAGDVVSFQRGVGELGKDRLFIDWRRRPDAPVDHLHMSHFTHVPLSHHFHRSFNQYPPSAAWNHPLFLHPPTPDHSHLHSRMSQQYSNYPYSYGNIIGSSPSPNYYDMMSSNTTVVNGNPCPTGSVVYLRSGAQVPQVQVQRAGGSSRVVEPMVFDSVPVVQGKAAAKRLRLFGVNMDCPISSSDDPVAAATYNSHTSQFQSPSSISSIPSVQFRSSNFNNYDSSPIQTPTTEESSDKRKGSMSLDLDI